VVADNSKFIQALRLVVQALPFAKEDREAFLEAVEARAIVASKAKQAKLDAGRPPPSREQQARDAACKRRYYERKQAAKKAAKLTGAA
jgi:hypothetical protein